MKLSSIFYTFLFISGLLFSNCMVVQAQVYPGASKVPGQQAKRVKMECAEFDEMTGVNLKLFPGAALRKDTSSLPKDFPPPPRGASACGCHPFSNTNYYIADLSYEALKLYYENALPPKGYTITGTGPSSENPADTQILFKSKTGMGYILVSGAKKGYSIIYSKIEKGCRCGGK